MTAGRSINYDALTQDALRGIVRAVLRQVAESGLPDEHHFYIAFDTQAPSVILSRRLKEKYPEEMTIVLQHRFWDLLVSDERFEVKLTFESIPERLVVPFAAVRMFIDPSARFTLQFGDTNAQDDQDEGAGPRRLQDGEYGDRKPNRFGQRSMGDRRPRSLIKKKSEGDRGADSAAASESRSTDKVPTVLVPRQTDPASRPFSAPVVASGQSGDIKPRDTQGDESEALPSAGSEPLPDVPAAAPGGGAKVFSLDQFRNKK